MTGGIFISYRRSDAKSDARSICQRLERTFGKGRVFIDVDSIKPGENFQSVLNNDLDKCQAMVVVIGPRWLDLLKSSGPGDSETSHDYVSLEIASALERKLPIFPVLVDGATIPDAKDLPDNLKPLALRQALSIRHDSFPRDMSGLEQELRPSISTRDNRKVAAISGLSVLLLGAIACYVWWSSATTYSKVGNFACFNEAAYPDSWREEATLCTAYGCNFGKMSQPACLTLGASKRSRTVIHGNTSTTRANECWLQNSCVDLRSHGEFTLFKM
jgi:hypothetical protein